MTDGCSDSQKDSDGDGVPDDVDNCPGTPSGESVDDGWMFGFTKKTVTGMEYQMM
jgi:hypothetical protein